MRPDNARHRTTFSLLRARLVILSSGIRAGSRFYSHEVGAGAMDGSSIPTDTVNTHLACEPV